MEMVRKPTMRMLVCTLGSKRHKNTLHFATEVAKALAADTMLLGIVDKERRVGDLGPVLASVAEELAEAQLPVAMRVETGDAERLVMAELEREPYDLVAVGALGGKRSRRTLLDSVGMRIVERAQSSVLLIRGNRPGLSRLLICASGTEQGQSSVWAGSSLACGAGAQATVLHVVDALPAMYTGLEQMEETLDEMLVSDSDRARELRWAARVVRDECEISEIKLRRGIAVDEILKEGREGDYDLIVLGSSRSAIGLVRALLGDLTREIASRAQRPVLIVRPSKGASESTGPVSPDGPGVSEPANA
jgi:nucleotide-binding universal stress UspA family protein